MMIFAVIGLATSLFYELKLLGLSEQQWLLIRIIYNTLQFGLAGLCGWMSDRIYERLSKSWKKPFREALASALALSVYRLSLYTLTVLGVGAELRQIAKVLLLYLVIDNILIGSTYRFVRKRVLARFGVRSVPVNTD